MTTLFSIGNSILVRPLPYPESGRIQWISERSGPAHEDVGAAPDYYRLRDESRVFEEIGAFNQLTVNWTGIEKPEQLDAAVVSASFFRVLRMRPLIGRYLARDEDGPKAPPVIVVSYDFWRNRLGGDPHAIGKTIGLDRLSRTIIGVMPEGFDFPRGTQIWMPLLLDESSQRAIAATRPIFTVSLIGRLKSGVSRQEAETDLTRLSSMIREQYKVFPTRFRWDLVIEAAPLQQHLTGQLRPALLALSAAAGLVLLIACVNLANLLLARAGIRQRDLAVRLALGASRARIAGQMLIEGFVLAAPGGLAGIGISWLAVRLLNYAKPVILTRYPPVSMDISVLAFTLGITLTASMVFSFAPAVSSAAIQIHEALKSTSLMHSGGRGAARLRKALVVAELGLSLMLLIGAVLLASTFLKLAHTDLGFRTDHLLTFRVNPIGPLDRDYSKFYSAVLDRLQALPITQSAALLLDIPLRDEGFYMTAHISVVGRPVVPFNERPVINNTVVSAGFAQTMGIPLKSGRTFDSHDSVRSAGASNTNSGAASGVPVVVNEAFVRRMFPGEDPVGQSISFRTGPEFANWMIIGVVGDVRGNALGVEPPAMIYRCACNGGALFRGGFVIRTAGDPKAAIRAAEEQVRAVDRDQPIFDVKTMDERRAAVIAPERFQLAVVGAFAVIALVLAAAGVYGVMSYQVTRRTREIGIRMAMGARPANVLRMVIGETMILVLIGVGSGLGGAWALTRYIESLLHGVAALDASAFTLAPVLLAAIMLIASLGPARNAARIDPVTALRND